MIAFIKAVLIGVAVYYVIGFVSRLLAPFLIKMFVRRMSRKFEDQVKKTNRSNNQNTKKYKNITPIGLGKPNCKALSI